MVSIAAFQANDPGSFHGLRIYKKTQKKTLFHLFYVGVVLITLYIIMNKRWGGFVGYFCPFVNKL